MGYVLKELKGMEIAKVHVDKLARADFEKVINDKGQTAPTQALHFRDLMFGAMKLGDNQRCYEGENLADPKKLNIRIKHTSKRRPGWHFDELPRLWRLLCKAEIDGKHDGMLTTAQIAMSAGKDRQAVLSRIKHEMLPAKQLNHGKNPGYIATRADAEKVGLRFVNETPESNFDAAPLAIQVLKFLLLTGVRFSEANEMQVSEIDWRRKTWTIPADRTKSGRKHIVPLVDLSLAILEKMERRRDADVPYMFAKGDPLTGAGLRPGGRPLTEGCVIRHLKRISGDNGITIHSFRRGLGSWTDSQFIRRADGLLMRKYDKDFKRAVLGHAVSHGLDYIYGADAGFETPCRILLSDWTDHLVHGPSKPSESAEEVAEPSESVEVEPSKSAELIDLSTRRIAGA
jgi:integrase